MFVGVAAVSLAITPASIRSAVSVSSPAQSLFALHAFSSSFPPVRWTSGSAAGKSILPARAPAFEARSCSSRGTSPLAAPLEFLRPSDEFRPNRQFVRSQFHCLGRGRKIHARHLEHHAPRLHHRHPVLRLPFALTHTSFSRLLGKRFVRKNPDPQFSAALDEPRDRHAGRFDLPVRNPGRFERLQSIVAKRQRAAAPRLARAPAALLL